MSAPALLAKLSTIAVSAWSVVFLAWSLQACCCGGAVPFPAPGPPGSITGQLNRPPADKPGGLEVYAVEMEVFGIARYAATHVPATATSYTLPVPPGIYEVVARLDNDPLSAAGHLFVNCSASSPPCSPTPANTYTVRVESAQTVSDIDVGDWASMRAKQVLWNVDTHGSPLLLNLQSSPTPKSLPSRTLPTPTALPAKQRVSSFLGVAVRLPNGWRDVAPPNDSGHSDDLYITNEGVGTPMALDNAGVWITVRLHIDQECTPPDWRYATAMATVSMEDGSNTFLFEDPAPRDGPQPFTGYSARVGNFVFDNCVELIMTAATKTAFENNLPTFVALVETAHFQQICPSCLTRLAP